MRGAALEISTPPMPNYTMNPPKGDDSGGGGGTTKLTLHFQPREATRGVIAALIAAADAEYEPVAVVVGGEGKRDPRDPPH